MKGKVDLIVFLELLASLYKYTYAFRNFGGNCVNMGSTCDIFINKYTQKLGDCFSF